MIQDITWYIAELIDEISVSGDPRNVVHRNLVLIRADTPEEAYEKCTRLGKSGEGSHQNPKGQLVCTKFWGIAELDRIYEDLGDGAEISFKQQTQVPPEEIKNWILPKDQLKAFLPPQRMLGPDYTSKEILKKARAISGDPERGGL